MSIETSGIHESATTDAAPPDPEGTLVPGLPGGWAEPPVPFAGIRCFAAGAIFLLAGDPAAFVYLIRRGQVRVFLISGEGRETTTALLGPGQLVGVSALAGRRTYHAYAQALTPAEAWVVPVDRLLARMVDDASLAKQVVAALTRRLILTERLIGDAALLRIESRVREAHQLMALCLGNERPRLTRDVLAKLVGARRESISRVASRMPSLTA